MQNFIMKGVCLLLIGILSACSSIVKKPEIENVKRVAIVSLYADQKVPNTKGLGVVKNWDSRVKLQVAEDALNIFSREFSKLGWQVVDPNKVLNSREYKRSFSVLPSSQKNTKLNKIADFAKNIYQQSFFTPAGMLPIQLNDSAANTQYYGNAQKADPKYKLSMMARQLGVDAVVLVQLDYCYGGGTFSLLGTGEAVITAGSAIKAVDRNGSMVINMPAIERCDGKRGKSKSSTVMLKGDLVFKHSARNKFRKMFIEATRSSARITAEQLKKAIS